MSKGKEQSKEERQRKMTNQEITETNYKNLKGSIADLAKMLKDIEANNSEIKDLHLVTFLCEELAK